MLPTPAVYIETDTGSVKSAHFDSEKAPDSPAETVSSVFGEPTTDDDLEAVHDEDNEIFNDKHQKSPLIPKQVLHCFNFSKRTLSMSNKVHECDSFQVEMMALCYLGFS